MKDAGSEWEPHIFPVAFLSIVSDQDIKGMENEMKFKIRADIAAAVVAFVFTKDVEFTRFAFAMWHVPR